jgi:hypothetical protein
MDGFKSPMLKNKALFLFLIMASKKVGYLPMPTIFHSAR